MIRTSKTFGGGVFCIRGIHYTKMGDLELILEKGDMLRLLFKGAAWKEFMQLLQEGHCRADAMGVLYPLAASLVESLIFCLGFCDQLGTSAALFQWRYKVPSI